MRIYDLKTSAENGTARVSVIVESNATGRRELWFSLPQQCADYLCSTRLDGFLVGMLYPAMQDGEAIHLEGCVSEKLLFNLNHYVIPLLMSYSPTCKAIRITANEISTERFGCQGVGTGFSGGVDSFCTFYDRYELETSPGYKINSLVFLNVGSHGQAQTESELEAARKKFYRRYDYLKAFTDEVDLDFIPLDSNLHCFHPSGHQKTHTLTSAAGILTLQNHFSKYYYSSSGMNLENMLNYAVRYKDIALGAYCDPILLPLLSTESLEFIPDGHPYTRTEKTLRILDYEPVRRYLNVCVNDLESHENCSVCPKCCRTLMTLDSAGRLSDFSGVFDIAKYKSIAERAYLVQQVLSQHEDPFAKDNIELAKITGTKLPARITCCTIQYAKKLKTYRKQMKKKLSTLTRNVFQTNRERHPVSRG